MTGLLVSVRSAAEAEIALAGGADLIDVKEPDRGSLGAADPAIWAEVLQVVGGRVPVSAALGELLTDYDPALLKRTEGLAYAKLGLAGCTSSGDWALRWQTAVSQLPPGVRPVAVAYADWRLANSPCADEILPIAARAGAPLLLVDTFAKSAGKLLDHLSIVAMETLKRSAAEHDMRLVLAGSLDEQSIGRLAPLSPAYFAVRGAVCDGARTQAVSLARVKRLATIVRTSVAAARRVVA